MSSKLLHIYCDESRQCEHRFMVLGGIIIEADNIHALNTTMANFRQETKMFSELKWSKVKWQKLNEYKTFVDFFFALNNTDNLHFKSIVIDNHQLNHKKFNGGDKEIGFQKFYYQLLFNCFGRCYYNSEEATRFIVHPDHRNSKYSLEEFKKILNNGMAKKFGNTVKPFISIEPKKSHDSETVQLNDIILGAIGFQKNGYHLLGTSSTAKIELANYIAKSAGLNNLIDNSPYQNSRFGIWNIRLQKK